jgi:hypothetical protein
MIFTFLLEHTTSVKVSVRFVVLLFFITVPWVAYCLPLHTVGTLLPINHDMRCYHSPRLWASKNFRTPLFICEVNVQALQALQARLIIKKFNLFINFYCGRL